ncbi:MAG TPA: ABC transporter ATP-binding protein [Aggregatilineaceae bacterium]|nr:ABC transporter ATP-binding protein [Aggregatilineaceae bacterium]
MSIVRTESLTKIYGDSDHQIHAVNQVNLEIEEGELLAIMGPSGSGKSTLLYLLGGLERPTSGCVRLKNQDLSSLNDDALSLLRRTTLGFIFQFYNLIPVLTAQENVAMPLTLDGVPRTEALRRADEALERVGLSDRRTHRPSELSGGQQQRVALARALVNHPALILGDEPTGNLDSRASDEVVQLLRRAADDWNQTIVLVTHDPRIAAHADRIIFLKDGAIVDENRLKGIGNADLIREQLSRVTM